MVQMASEDQLDLLAVQDHKARREELGSLEDLDQMEGLVSQARQEHQVGLDSLDQEVPPAGPGLQEVPEIPVSPAGWE
jgi:hypothetical protein